MKILSTKLIPLKVLVGERGLIVAWHWPWSITWRWVVRWSKGRYKWEVKSFNNDENGFGWRHFCLGRFGIVRVEWQPNMPRTAEA